MEDVKYTSAQLTSPDAGNITQAQDLTTSVPTDDDTLLPIKDFNLMQINDSLKNITHGITKNTPLEPFEKVTNPSNSFIPDLTRLVKRYTSQRKAPDTR